MFKVGRQSGGDWRRNTVSQASENLWALLIANLKDATLLAVLFTSQIKTKDTDFLKDVQNWCMGLYFRPKLMCGSLFSFACGERVRVVSRGVSDTCSHVSHVSPWVTTPPPPSAPCGSHWYVGDNINIWESLTNGTEKNNPVIGNEEGPGFFVCEPSLERWKSGRRWKDLKGENLVVAG